MLPSSHVFGDPEPDEQADGEGEIVVEPVVSDFELLMEQRERKRARACATNAQPARLVDNQLAASGLAGGKE